MSISWKKIVRLDDGLAKILVMKESDEKTFSKKMCIRLVRDCINAKLFLIFVFYSAFLAKKIEATRSTAKCLNPQVSFVIPLSRVIIFKSPLKVEISGLIFKIKLKKYIYLHRLRNTLIPVA